MVYARKMTGRSNQCSYTEKKKMALTSHQSIGKQHEYLKYVYNVFMNPYFNLLTNLLANASHIR